MPDNVYVKEADYLTASAGCQDTVIGFVPLKPAFSGFDDLDLLTAMRTDIRARLESLVKPFVAALKARRRIGYRVGLNFCNDSIN